MKMLDHKRSKKGILVLALALCAAMATIFLLGAEEGNLPSPDSLPPHYKFLLRQTNGREEQLEAEVQRLKAKLVKSEATTKGAGQSSGPLPPGHETNGVTHHKALSDYERYLFREVFNDGKRLPRREVAQANIIPADKKRNGQHTRRTDFHDASSAEDDLDHYFNNLPVRSWHEVTPDHTPKQTLQAKRSAGGDLSAGKSQRGRRSLVSAYERYLAHKRAGERFTHHAQYRYEAARNPLFKSAVLEHLFAKRFPHMPHWAERPMNWNIDSPTKADRNRASWYAAGDGKAAALLAQVV